MNSITSKIAGVEGSAISPPCRSLRTLSSALSKSKCHLGCELHFRGTPSFVAGCRGDVHAGEIHLQIALTSGIGVEVESAALAPPAVRSLAAARLHPGRLPFVKYATDISSAERLFWHVGLFLTTPTKIPHKNQPKFHM